MFAHSRRHAPAPSGRRVTYHCTLPVALAGLCLATFLAGCTGTPPSPVAGAHPANPDVPSRPAAYHSVIAPYASQRPRDPSEWRKNNERVAPQEKE
jgi:hypothetical protein